MAENTYFCGHVRNPFDSFLLRLLLTLDAFIADPRELWPRCKESRTILANVCGQVVELGFKRKCPQEVGGFFTPVLN